MLKGMLSELWFGDTGVAIPTHVRNDNSTLVYQIGPVRKVAKAKRLDCCLESNREELGNDNWMIVVYIPGGVNTSDGLTKATSSANFGGVFLNGGSFVSLLKSKRLILRNDCPRPDAIVFTQ